MIRVCVLFIFAKNLKKKYDNYITREVNGTCVCISAINSAITTIVMYDKQN
jgi:hypothetical protein